MVLTLKSSSVLDAKLKPLYWAILLVFATEQQAIAAVIDYADGQNNGGTVTLRDNLAQLQVTTGTAEQSGSINGAFSLEKTGSGILIFSGVNSYQGDTNITAGTLRLSGGDAIANTSGTVNVSAGATLNVATSEAIDGFAGAGTASINAGQTLSLGQNNTGGNFSGDITGSGNLKSNGNRTLSGNNDYTGTTTVNSGTVTVSATGDINESSAISILAAGTLNIDGGGNAAIGDGVAVSNAGHFILTGSDETIGSINGAGNINLNGQTLTTGGDGTSTTLSGVISGSGGGLTKQGTGTFTLSGTNTYTGATTINAGILQASNASALGSNSAVTVGGGLLDLTTGLSIGSLAGAGNVTLNANTLTTGGNNTSTNYSGVLSGTGGLTKQGSGTQTLSGINTYSGGTTVSSGTLQGTTTSLQGNITNNANVTFDQTTTGTYAGAISGTGGLTKTSTGTVTLSGANTYSGGTTISGGILEVGADNQLGSGILTMNGGTLRNTNIYAERNAAILNTGTTSTIDVSNAFGYLGVISGDGNLNKTGAGDLALVGNNTYTGTTTISAGTLQIGGGVTTGAIAGDIINNSELLFFRSNAYTHAGDVSGTGLISKLASGTATITGALTHTGGTTITVGALQIGNGGTTGSISGDITNNSALTFNRSDAVAYTDVISGTGSFTQAGTGNTSLTDVNTYTGVTTINDGILSVNGSIANSSTTVNASGTLGGNGTVGNVTINNGGTFAPGNSIGTINVTGDVVFSAGSHYNVEVDAAGNSDKIIVTGTATLTGATVNVQPEAGTYDYATDYTILTAAGGLGGTTFGSVNSNLAFLTPTLSYDANNVLLKMTRNDISFNSVASTPNQTAVSTVLDNNTTALESIVSSITPLTDTGAQQAFDSLSGIQHTQSQAAMNKLGQQFQQLLFSRSSQSANGTLGFDAQNFNPMQGYQLADNSNNWQIDTMDASTLASRQRGWWMQGVGGVGSIDDTSNASGADYQSGGVALGVDTHWRNFVVGIAGSYTRSNVDPFAGDNDIESFQAGVYGSWARDHVYVNASVGLGLHKTDATRIVTVGSSVNTATSNYDSVNLGTALEAGKDIPLNLNTTLTPYVGVSYSHNNRDGFIETGAGTANLSVKQQDEDSLRTTLGLRLSRDIQTNNNKTITPAASIAYVREHLDSAPQFEAGFAAVPTSTFRVDGSDLDQDRLQVGLGITGHLNENTTLNVGYSGELASSDEYHSFAATVRFVW